MTKALGPGDPGYEAQLKQAMDEARRKVEASKSPFTVWLRTQAHRQDPVGGMARTVIQDPMWPEPKSRQELMAHLMRLGVRAFILRTAQRAWNEFERASARERRLTAQRSKNKNAKAARRKTRGKRKKRR